MLFPDGGETLRHAPTPGLWEQTLARYAQLQIDTAPVADDLLRLGALDRRPSSLPGLYERLIADEPDAARLRGLGPRLEEACARLDATLPVTIEQYNRRTIAMQPARDRITESGCSPGDKRFAIRRHQ